MWGQFIFVMIFTVFVGVVAVPKVPGLPEGVQNWLNQFQISLGLDLQGGLHLEYELDLSGIDQEQRDDAIKGVQAVIERRVNALGVAESIVQVVYRGEQRFLIIELPGIEDIQKAKDIIKETPFLEFKEERTEEEIIEIVDSRNEAFAPMNAENKAKAQVILDEILKGRSFEDALNESKPKDAQEDFGKLSLAKKGTYLPELEKVLFDDSFKVGEVYKTLVETNFGWNIIKKVEIEGDGDNMQVSAQYIPFTKIQLPSNIDDRYKSTELTGRYLEGALVSFGSVGVSSPGVSLQFDKEGSKIFADLTKKNLDKTIAIYIDNEIITSPVVRTEITDGQAEISGDYSLDEAKKLAGRLNEGALPVPINLVSQQSVGASIGIEALKKSVKAGAIGLFLIIVYMIVYYRILGLIAGGAIALYAATIVTLFKMSSVMNGGLSITLTLAGFAGLILSIGMAVDANILIFERIREELKRGRGIRLAVEEGFNRAWIAIRDGNISTIITALILTTMGTGFVKGFAVILIIGVLLSMFTAIVLVKIVMHFSIGKWIENNLWLIYNCRSKK